MVGVESMRAPVVRHGRSFFSPAAAAGLPPSGPVAFRAMESDTGLTPDEVEIFARGLYYIASVDGIEPREADLIAEFLRDTGASISVEDLKGVAFSPIEAAQVLEATYLRRIFVKAAIALVKADGIYSDAERRALGEFADVFGLSNTEFGELEQDVSRHGLE